MKIKIDLNTQSIDDAIQKLESYADDLERKAETLKERLGSMGYEIVSSGYYTAQYDGTNDVSVELNKEGDKLIIKASGYTVMFIEFGTGVYYPDTHPQIQEFGFARGTYGKGYGKRGTWAYRGDPGTNGWERPDRPGLIFTHGNPASMAMYNAKQQLRSQVIEIAKEVFRS